MSKEKINNIVIPLLVLVALVGWLDGRLPLRGGEEKSIEKQAVASSYTAPESVVLPIRWADIGERLVETGVIDVEKLEQLYAQRGGLSQAEKELLTDVGEKGLVMRADNSAYLLNLLWAFGLANKSAALEEGPMRGDPQMTGSMASTGGWTLARGPAMDHYSQHALVELGEEEEALVEEVAKNIFRPCCGNSTYFPDCNHGMAMLGLLQLMAKEGASEEQMYEVALKVNSLWFPGTYQAIADYFALNGQDWQSVDPKVILSANYSSGSGYQAVVQALEGQEGYSNGGGCGV